MSSHFLIEISMIHPVYFFGGPNHTPKTRSFHISLNSTTAKTCCGNQTHSQTLADAPHSPSPLWFILFGQLLLDRKRQMKNNSIIIIMLGVVVALMAALLFRLKLFTVEEEEDDLRLFTVEELALYNGTHPDLPILLGILG